MSYFLIFPRKPLFIYILIFILTQGQAGTGPSHLNSILDIFSHCTLVVKFGKHPTDLHPLHPLLIYVGNFPSKPEFGPAENTFLLTNVSFTRRRQIPKFCWAYVYPDMGVKFALSTFLYSPIFPRPVGSAYPIHIIWLASPATNSSQIQTIYGKLLSTELMSLGSHEYYFTQPGLNGNVQFYHLNMYYRQESLKDFPISANFEPFSEISCVSRFKMECYQNIEDETDKMGMAFNKYSWAFVDWLTWAKIVHTFTQTFIEMQKKHFQFTRCPDWIQIANQSQSLDDFIAYTILSESLYNMSFPMKVYRNRKYIFYGNTRQYDSKIHQVVLVGTQSYSFLSCYGIQKENSYKAFIDPFDKYVWLCIITIVLIFTAIRGMITWSMHTLDVAIISIAVLLEISILSNINRVVEPQQLKLIFWIWIFCAVILTSLYKTIFTTEVILPYKRSPVWTHIYDLQDQGFQFFLPIIPDNKLFYDLYTSGAKIHNILSFEFFADAVIAAGYEGDSPRLLGYKRFAKALTGMDINGGREDTANKNLPSIWRKLHYKWPSHVYPNLSRCADKLAYLDRKENIKDIIPYLNDNVDGTVFMEGADEDFLLTWYAIQVQPTIRRNFVLDRLKLLMVSGIYKWWEEWFRKGRPKKLFPYYANWAGPKVEALEKLDFTSRVVTTLQIWGICCGFCAVVGILEVGYKQVQYFRLVVQYA
ncbi:hypothetical protein Fcan01_28311 [Folsomia candida]|uniref:Uncharacterized protein n=1 Tax=Folsomia candida TaxID=158441 RepID=A0A226CWM6_FOLCA|nr:hypothetical protein Fcan01_28311 [Folsomia candida]